MKLVAAALFILIPNTFAKKKIDDGYPDLQELFPAVPLSEARRSPMGSTIFDLDIERIDVAKFKKKLERFAKTVTDNVTIADARRQHVPYYSSRQYYRAAKHLIRAKTLDLMLQTIYMARHSIRSLEGEKYFSDTDTGYRIAFLYRRIRSLWRRIMDVYTMSSIKAEKTSDSVKANMLLHMKAIKLHTDYMYLWWVLIGVDGKHLKMSRKTTKSKGSTQTTSAINSNETELTDYEETTLGF